MIDGTCKFTDTRSISYDNLKFSNHHFNERDTINALTILRTKYILCYLRVYSNFLFSTGAIINDTQLHLFNSSHIPTSRCWVG
jgi:hypothetical protein